jgi:1,4-dihydroxy-2-naphthoate octaprenyltransferase
MQRMKLNFNWFFLTAATASYLFGVVIAISSGRPFNLVDLLAGLVIFYALNLLQVVQRLLTSNRVNPFTRARSVGQNQSSSALMLILGAFFAIFGGLYFLLRSEVLIGTNLFLLTILALIMFLSMGRFSRLWFDSMTWLFEGLVVAPVLFLLGSAIQEYQFSYLFFLLWMPLFFLYAASAITLLFSDYDQNSSSRNNGFIASIGWEKALKFHHGLVILTYVALIIYLAISNTWSRNWPALLLSLVSGAEVFFLEQIARGMRPNWKLLRALAIVQFFSLIYLLAYPLLIK